MLERWPHIRQACLTKSVHCSIKLLVIRANQNEQLEKGPLFHSLQLIALRVVLIEWRLRVRVSSVK